jgi:hypothetical protein
LARAMFPAMSPTTGFACTSINLKISAIWALRASAAVLAD